jgi:hypothetical protein
MSGTDTDDSPDFIGEASRCIGKHSTAQSHDKDLMISIYPLPWSQREKQVARLGHFSTR